MGEVKEKGERELRILVRSKESQEERKEKEGRRMLVSKRNQRSKN